ncbi:unnamed protein product [Euphydryas editha]|uniref:Uncharacterized protein n=1 Tax=Euphydryas editha TaxID=104508 RepID=A0AAU9TJ64_EUPED|nr:unnamed protein product [Euphydryas editha]
MKKSDRNKKGTSVNLTSKPFCNCRQCKCRNCPDIRELLPISFHGKSKITEKSTEKKLIEDIKVSQCSHDRDLSLITLTKNSQDCNCAEMARALRSDVHVNLNLPKQRFKE